MHVLSRSTRYIRRENCEQRDSFLLRSLSPCQHLRGVDTQIDPFDTAYQTSGKKCEILTDQATAGFQVQVAVGNSIDGQERLSFMTFDPVQ